MIPVGADGREMVHLAGDMDQGLSASVLLNRGATQITTRYKGRFNVTSFDYLEGKNELYVSKEELLLHVICPSCGHQMAISSKNKAIHYEPATSLISVDDFGCPWEKGRGTDNTANDRMGFGLGLCGAWFVIDRNVMRDA